MDTTTHYPETNLFANTLSQHTVQPYKGFWSSLVLTGQRCSQDFLCFIYRITSSCKVHPQFKVTPTAQYLENWVLLSNCYPTGVWLWLPTQCVLNYRHMENWFENTETFSDVPSNLHPPSRLLWTTQLLWSTERTPSESIKFMTWRKKIRRHRWVDKHFCWLVLRVSSKLKTHRR